MTSPTFIFRLEIKQTPVLERFSVRVISPPPSDTRMRIGILTVMHLPRLSSFPWEGASPWGTSAAGASPLSASIKPNFHSVGTPHWVQWRLKDRREESALYCSIVS